jgi:hypothetical protein
LSTTSGYVVLIMVSSDSFAYLEEVVPGVGFPGADTPCSVPKHVSFEVLEANGTWSPCTSGRHDIETPRSIAPARIVESSSSVMHLSTVDCLQDNASEVPFATHTNPQLDSSGFASTSDILDLRLQNSFESDGQEMDWTMSNYVPDFSLESGLDIEQHISLDVTNKTTQNVTHYANQHTMMTGCSSEGLSWLSLDLQTTAFSSLADLPFKEFQNGLARRGECDCSSSSLGGILVVAS